MTALVAESYMRAYSAAVRLQQLVELEEIIAVRILEAQRSAEAAAARSAVGARWARRFAAMAPQPDFMRRVLGVRALLLAPPEQVGFFDWFVEVAHTSLGAVLALVCVCVCSVGTHAKLSSCSCTVDWSQFRNCC